MIDREHKLSVVRQAKLQALLQRAGTDDGGSIIEGGIHLAKRPKLLDKPSHF